VTDVEPSGQSVKRHVRSLILSRTALAVWLPNRMSRYLLPLVTQVEAVADRPTDVVASPQAEC
jgi:hypothetical protein